MDLAELVTPKLVPILKVMGRSRWLEAYPDPEHSNRTMFKTGSVKCSKQQAPEIEKFVIALRGTKSAAGACAMYAISRCLANGPKCFQATTEQCESMLEVEANIDCSEYQQAYPQLIIRITPEFRRQVAEKHSRNPNELPMSILVMREDNLFTFFCRFKECEHTCCFYLRPGRIIEDLLKPMEEGQQCRLIDDVAGTDDREDYWEARAAHDLMRVAVNLSYLLLFTGCREDDSERRKIAKKRPDLLIRTPTYVFLAQEVTVREVVVRQVTGDGHHASPKPHWRRGHWARVVCGVGRTQRRLTFRKPVFVMAEQFTGDIADTSVQLSSTK